MRNGYTITELLIGILILLGLGFGVYAVFYGTPTVKMLTGIAIVALFLPSTISGIIHGRITTVQCVAMMIGAVLIASKFVG
jgi:hypothetical protein